MRLKSEKEKKEDEEFDRAVFDLMRQGWSYLEAVEALSSTKLDKESTIQTIETDKEENNE